MPRASIIITTHNRPHLLPRAIASARSAGEDVEVIVVDDASSDETATVCQSTSGINYVRLERNQGVAGARNAGLVASSGRYISFLDDDDVRLPGSLDQQIQALVKSPEAMLCYAQAIPEGASGKRGQPRPSMCPQGDILWDLLVRNFMPCGTVVFRRAGASQVGLLDDSIPGIDDWDMWIRMAELFSVVAIEAPVLIWRQSTPISAQGSSDTIRLIMLGRNQFNERWVKLPRMLNASRSQQRAVWRAFSTNIAEHLIWETFTALRQLRPGPTFAGARTLLQLDPIALLDILRRWMSGWTIITLVQAGFNGSGMKNAKNHFKRIRSNLPRQ